MSALRLAMLAAAVSLAGCGSERDLDQYGANPDLPEAQRGMFPNMEIAKPAEWGDLRPTVPQGFTITPIATDLKIPRQMLVLPNGDILIAEGMGGGAPKLTPKDFIAGRIKKKGTSPVAVKVASHRAKVEHDDAARVAAATGLPLAEVVSRAEEAWRHREARP